MAAIEGNTMREPRQRPPMMRNRFGVCGMSAADDNLPPDVRV
jgi:hypothetical protein